MIVIHSSFPALKNGETPDQIFHRLSGLRRRNSLAFFEIALPMIFSTAFHVAIVSRKARSSWMMTSSSLLYTFFGSVEVLFVLYSHTYTSLVLQDREAELFSGLAT